jgi:hypothetical protein
MPQLQDLELGGRNITITDQGLESLRQPINLRRFQGCWTPGISDKGLVGLSHRDQLEDVNVLGTQTGDDTIRPAETSRDMPAWFTERHTEGCCDISCTGANQVFGMRTPLDGALDSLLGTPSLRASADSR